jgi:hypothetical protein
MFGLLSRITGLLGLLARTLAITAVISSSLAQLSDRPVYMAIDGLPEMVYTEPRLNLLAF